MDRFVVHAGRPLAGEVTVSGAKNAALKQMAASLLARGRTVLRNVPEIADVAVMAEVLGAIGATVTRHEPAVLVIDVPDEIVPEAP